MAEQTMGHQYARWKSSIPFIYDWFTHHNLNWPSITCRWGSVVEDLTYKTKQNVYLSERTGESKDPNRLLVLPVQVVKPRVAAAETIAGFNEDKASQFVEATLKSIIHPGEVNKIREIPQQPSIVATHSDAKEVFLWHFDRQPNRSEHKSSPKASVPDLVLTGHEEQAQFALSTTTGGPLVASGGSDNNVLVWDLRDYDSGSLLKGGLQSQNEQNPTLREKVKLAGHTATVEEVVFKPGSTEELASVSDDFSIRFWDTRLGSTPSTTIANAHNDQDVQCVDWSKLDSNLLVTGAADGSLKIWDRRKPNEATYSSTFHTRSLLRVEWANYRPGVLASGGYDGIVCVWDLNNKRTSPEKSSSTEPPQEIIFQHAGHRNQIADFQWHPTDPFTMMSVSENDEAAGGTLQVWRIHDFIYRPEAEVIQELTELRDKLPLQHPPKAEPEISTKPTKPEQVNGEQKTETAVKAEQAAPAASLDDEAMPEVDKSPTAPEQQTS